MSDSADEIRQPHLSDAQRTHLQNWATENIPHGQCPWCLGVHWQIGDPLILPAYLAGGGELVVLPITCEQCAYVRFHSARQMGFVG
jgi:hypothetical protein